MIDRQNIFKYTEEHYGVEPDHPWQDENAILRHPNSGKWFALIMNVKRNRLGLAGEETTDVINLKCDKLLTASLRRREGYLPAYHMNKDNWITILMDGTVPLQEILELLDLSYELTRPKIKKKKSE